MNDTEFETINGVPDEENIDEEELLDDEEDGVASLSEFADEDPQSALDDQYQPPGSPDNMEQGDTQYAPNDQEAIQELRDEAAPDDPLEDDLDTDSM